MGTNLIPLLHDYKGLYKTNFSFESQKNPGNKADNLGYLVGKNVLKVIKSLHPSVRKPIHNQIITPNNN